MDVHNESWLDATVWSDNSDPSSDNDYFLAVLDGVSGESIMRTTPLGIFLGGSTNFLGNSLTVPAGTRLQLKQTGQTATASIRNGEGDLILDGGTIFFAPNPGNNQPFLRANEFHVTATEGATISQIADMNRAQIAATLTGPGDLLVTFQDEESTGRSIVFTEVDNYTGTITVEKGMVLDFDEDALFAGGIQLLGSSKLNVDQVLTFHAGTLIDPANGAVPIGVYTGSSLDALGSHYENNGGIIIVQRVVTTANDEDDGSLDSTLGQGVSLREAIAHSLSGSLITFALSLDGETIQLDATLGQLVIDKSLSIDASALPNGIIIDGGSNGDFVKDGNETRCFLISDSNSGTQLDVSLSQLTIQKGVSEGDGGNMRNRENLTLTNCRIINGRTSGEGNGRGGGIFSISANLTMNSCTISDNRAQGLGGTGGGIEAIIGGDLTLIDCNVLNNQAENFGGGIHSQNDRVILENCTIARNQAHGATGGGGISFSGNVQDEAFEITNCTIVDNQALNGAGGGISTFFGDYVLSHCTVVGNVAADGQAAGVAHERSTSTSMEFRHCIVQDNGPGLDLGFGATGASSQTFSFAGENLIGSVDPNIVGENLNAIPILLAPLGDYGGPTETMPPLFGSPAINTATSSTATEDQRGFLIFGIPDIGAAEFQDTNDLLSDNDGDGLIRILELALGTDPDVADFDAEGRPSIGLDEDGDIALTFGRGSEFIDGTILLVERSTTLEAGSFDEVYRFEFNFATSTIAAGSGIVEDVQADQFTITDETQAQNKAFYRIKALLSD